MKRREMATSTATRRKGTITPSPLSDATSFVQPGTGFSSPNLSSRQSITCPPLKGRRSMSEREESLDETYTAESGWERAVLHLTLKVPQRLDSPDHDNGLGLIQEILDDASFDITVEPLDLAARDASIRDEALRAVQELEGKWVDSSLHGKERGEPWAGWLVGLVRDLRAAIDGQMPGLESDCASCGEGMPQNECSRARRRCGHHCNHSWEQDECCWCGTSFGEGGVEVKPEIEALAAQVHEAWMTTKRDQGVTSRPSEWGEEQMVPYADLSERVKDLDRGTVRAVLDAQDALRAVIDTPAQADETVET